MCGRFTLTAALKTIQGRFDFDDDDTGAVESDFRPNANVSPTQNILTALRDGDRVKPRMMRWGLIPSWSKQEKSDYLLINARAETLDVKPVFKPLIARNRCIIIADGFYEFRADGKKKIPVRFSMKDESLFSMAGLYDCWKDTGSEKIIFSCTIITTEPNDLVRPVHNRMPVVLSRDDEKRWLDVSMKLSDMKTFLAPFDSSMMTFADADPGLTSSKKKNLNPPSDY